MPATYKSRFPMISAAIAPKVGAAVKVGAEVISEDAARRVSDPSPMGQGLIASIRVEREGIAEYAVNAGDDDAFYARFVEFGHAARDGSEVPPHPFMIPAKEANEANVVALVTAALRGL